MFELIKQKKELRKLDRELRIKEIQVDSLQYSQAIKFLSEASNIVSDTELKDWQILSSGGRLDEGGHQDMQASAYNLYHTNVHARAIVRTLVKFVLGIGPKIEPAEKSNKKVKEAWKNFTKINKFSRREKEIATRLFRDGEVFLRLFRDEENGEVTIRFIRPLLVATPQNKQLQGITFGIKTNPDDIEEVIEYYKCDASGNYKETIPADQIIHLKIFADSDEKRGISVYKVCANRIKQYDGWIEDRIALNKVRSAIALIRKVSGSAANIRTLREKNRSDVVSSDRNKQKTPYRGTVITASKDIEYEMLSPNINATDVKDDGRAILLSIAAGIGFPEMMFTADYCADLQTEVLTDHGFVDSITAYRNSFKLGTVKQDTGELEYQCPMDWIFSNYNGDMYLYEGKGLNFCVSRNHHMWLRPENSRKLISYEQDKTIDGFRKCTLSDTSDDAWRTKEASMRNFIEPINNDILQNKTILLKKYNYNSRNDQNTKNTIRDKDRYFNIEEMVEFVGWFVTEGSVNNKSGHINICQTFKNRNNVEEIDKLLKKMPVEFSVKDYDNLGLSKHTARYWRTYDMALAGWVRVNCGVGARNKRLPKFVWELPIDLKQKLLDTLIKGDGHEYKIKNHFRFDSFSNILLNDVQRLAFELGYHTTLRKFENNKSGYVYISKGHNRKIKREDIEKFRYSGIIWCATVPNGLLVTRREGRILISGNSNANYSSSLIAQNPFVREIEEWQDFFKDFYKELFVIVMKTGIKYGELPENIDTDCIVEFSPLIAADVEKIAKAYEILFKYKIVSKKTWRYKMGLDDEIEKYYIDEEDAENVNPPTGFNPQPGLPPAVPGVKSPFNVPLSPRNQYGAQMEEMVEALKERDWDRIIELADEIEKVEEVNA